MARQVDLLPPRLLPVLYFALSHAALGLAFAAIAFNPRGVAGFFYHDRMLAVVHLVTLGWITASILGALYLVGPIAMRVTFPARRADYVAFGLFFFGVAGMVTHFWIGEYSGMAWSASTAAAGVLTAGLGILSRLRASAIPRAISAHVALAFLNIAIAATLGVLIGFNKVHPFLPGHVLSNVFAHAHLAAIGWASMMVMGVGYRLLPMVLPAQMPQGARLWATAVLLEVGAGGLSLCFALRSAWVAAFALITVAAFAVFVGHAIWMVRHPRPRPPAIRTPDPAVLHAAAALACLAADCGLGIWLSVAAPSPATGRGAMAYGVLGLLGFLGQMVVAMEGRLLPLFAWYLAFANAKGREVKSPHEMPWRPAQYLVFALWLAGVPALAAGLTFDVISVVRASAWFLLAATVIDTAQAALIVSHAYPRPTVR